MAANPYPDYFSPFASAIQGWMQGQQMARQTTLEDEARKQQNAQNAIQTALALGSANGINPDVLHDAYGGMWTGSADDFGKMITTKHAEDLKLAEQDRLARIFSSLPPSAQQANVGRLGVSGLQAGSTPWNVLPPEQKAEIAYRQAQAAEARREFNADLAERRSEAEQRQRELTATERMIPVTDIATGRVIEVPQAQYISENYAGNPKYSTYERPAAPRQVRLSPEDDAQVKLWRKRYDSLIAAGDQKSLAEAQGLQDQILKLLSKYPQTLDAVLSATGSVPADEPSPTPAPLASPGSGTDQARKDLGL